MDPDPAAPIEVSEKRTWPWVKKRRVLGPLGQGWDNFTPEKSPSPKAKRYQKSHKEPEVKVETLVVQRLSRFSEINLRQQ